MNEWQTIATAPKDGRWVLIHVPSSSEVQDAYTTAARWTRRGQAWNLKYSAAALGFDVPSHWMPLPEAPAK